jgi:hypothetical protein
MVEERTPNHVGIRQKNKEQVRCALLCMAFASRHFHPVIKMATKIAAPAIV